MNHSCMKAFFREYLSFYGDRLNVCRTLFLSQYSGTLRTPTQECDTARARRIKDGVSTGSPFKKLRSCVSKQVLSIPFHDCSRCIRSLQSDQEWKIDIQRRVRNSMTGASVAVSKLLNISGGRLSVQSFMNFFVK